MAANRNLSTSRPDISAVYAANIHSLCHKSEELLQYLNMTGNEEAYIKVHGKSRVTQAMVDRIAAII